MKEAYINNTRVDLYDSVPMSLNYAIADIRNPDKRNTSYSKTIVMPGSKVNNELFGYIFEISKESLVIGNGTVNFDPDFNPNLKADFKLFDDSLLQFNGYCQLLKINRRGEEIEYEIAAFGSLGDLFANVEGYNLTDLDLSEYDHDFTKANQKDSWDTKIQKNGSDYVNFSAGKPIGEGYVYPLIDYGFQQTQASYRVVNLYPAVYVKTYIDKLFQFGGYSYDSDFFESDFFKSLIIPFNGEIIKLSQAQIDQRKFYANTPSSGSNDTNSAVNNTQNIFFHQVLFTNDSTPPGSDPNGVYDTSTGWYTVNKKGDYELKVDLSGIIATTPPVGTVETKRVTHYVQAIIYDQSGNVVAQASTGSSGVLFPDTSFTISLNSGVRALNQGDRFRVYIKWVRQFRHLDGSSNEVSGSDSSTLTLNSGSAFYNNPISVPVVEGETLQLNSAIPKEVPIKDFFLSIVKMFNLYVKPDPNNEKNLIVETLVDFYSSNQVIDWTGKLDTSRDVEIRPVSEIEGKNYLFSYKEDNDFFNEDYNSKYNRIYGDYNKAIRNDFVKGTKSLDLIFSPTPSVGVFNTDLVIPRFVKGNDDGSVSQTSVNIRILQYGGVLSAGGTWSYVGAGGTTAETTYPYAGHLDNPYTPTIDLNFDIPEQIYWSSGGINNNYTNNNLYNKYWRQFIEEITDKDSKIVVAYFRLRSLDVFQLDFKNFIHVDGINYRLNKILDYDPSSEETTKVELSKIKSGASFTPSTVDVDTDNDPSTFDIVEGGEDEVRALTAVTNIKLIEGGLDAVINLDDVTNIDIINGGAN